MAPYFRALISSDWNQCLSPCGPFDPLVFHYPDLGPQIEHIFRQYTGNRIPLGRALDSVMTLVGRPLEKRQMDTYLDASFCLYGGVSDLVAWCRANRVAFMINTTGFAGYFQRLFARGLFPVPDALASNRAIVYPAGGPWPETVFDLADTGDKGRFTQSYARSLGIGAGRVIIIGDSGGDGPHFSWGSRHGATLVASMAKDSLLAYCERQNIRIDRFLGRSGQSLDGKDRPVDFMDLVPLVEQLIRC